MNKAHRVVWNKAHGTWTAVSETTRGRSKAVSAKRASRGVVGAASLTCTAVTALLSMGTAAAQTWTGATSTDWTTRTNWSTGAVPTAASNVTIDKTSPNATE